MYQNTQSAKIVSVSPRLRESSTPAAPAAPAALAKLTKKMHFLRFLQKEMGTVRTEAEKEAVLGILLKTKVQVHTLEQECNEIKSLDRFTSHRIQ